MDFFPKKSLSKYLMDTIDFNKHVHDIDIFINDKWRKYAGGDIGRLFKITRRLELRFWPTRKRSEPSQGDFFARIALQPSNPATKAVSLNPIHGEVYSIQHYIIKFVFDLWQVGGFLRVLRFSPPLKLTSTIWLKYCWKWC